VVNTPHVEGADSEDDTQNFIPTLAVEQPMGVKTSIVCLLLTGRKGDSASKVAHLRMGIQMP